MRKFSSVKKLEYYCLVINFLYLDQSWNGGIRIKMNTENASNIDDSELTGEHNFIREYYIHLI